MILYICPPSRAIYRDRSVGPTRDPNPGLVRCSYIEDPGLRPVRWLSSLLSRPLPVHLFMGRTMTDVADHTRDSGTVKSASACCMLLRLLQFGQVMFLRFANRLQRAASPPNAWAGDTRAGWPWGMALDGFLTRLGRTIILNWYDSLPIIWYKVDGKAEEKKQSWILMMGKQNVPRF